jgi:hypothetical protein
MVVHDITPEIAQYLGLTSRTGVIVTDVREGSPADDVGIQPQDVILQVNRAKIASKKDYLKNCPEKRQNRISFCWSSEVNPPSLLPCNSKYSGRSVMKSKTESCELSVIYSRLNSHFGDLHWWPADSSFEVILGAILTQNTAWQNVERAIENLKALNLLEPQLLYEMDHRVLEELIRPSGYFRIKAARIKNFLSFCKIIMIGT